MNWTLMRRAALSSGWTQGKRMNKPAKIGLGILAGLILIVFIGLSVVLKPAFEYGLHRAGFDKARVGGADFSFSGTTLKNLQLDGAGNSVGEVKLYSTLGDALAGHLTKVEIKDAKLQWPPPLGPAGKAAGALNLLSKQVTLTNAVLTVKTAAGDLPVNVTGDIVDKGDAYKADLAVTAESSFAKLDGKLGADLIKASRLAKLDFKINEARLALPDFSVKRASGWIDADVDPAKPLPFPTAQLDFGSVVAYGLPLQGASLKVSSDADRSEFLATAEVPNDSGDLALDFSIDRKDKDADKVSLRAEAKLRKLDALNLANLKGEGNFLLALTGAVKKTGDLSDMSQWSTLQGSAGIDMEKLSLPGLLSNAEALATVRLGLDPAQRIVTAQAVDGAMSFNGTVTPLEAMPLYLNVPANAKSPATITWAEQEKVLKVDFDGADFTGLNVMAKQVAAHLMANLAAHPVAEGTLDVGELSHMTIAQSQFFLPVHVALKLNPLAPNSTVTAISGTVTEKHGRLTAKIAGQHDAAGNKGELTISMPPTPLPENVTSLATIFPVSQRYLQDGYGIIGLSGDFVWAKRGAQWETDSRGQLYLKDFSCTVKGNAISGIDTVMDLDTLMPLTLTKQQVAVGSINVGLPLSNGVAVISLDNQGLFTLDSASWSLAGGTVTSSPFSMRLPEMSTDLTLTATGLDLASVFSLMPTEGLQATGTLNGRIPLQIRNGAFTIVNGTLQTTGPGTVRYSPSHLPSFLANTQQQQLLDLKTALTHFDYTSLGMIINGQLGQPEKIVLRVQGKNPLFYNGHPVDFSLNLEGPATNVLKYSPGTGQLPESIRHQLQAYESSHAKL